MTTQLITNRADQLKQLSAATGVSAERVAYAAITQLQGRPELWVIAQANPGSFITAVLAAAEQGLDFSKPNEVHLVPYEGKKPKIALQRGYKGWLKLARRSDGVLDVDAFPVYDGGSYERFRGGSQSMSYEPPPFGKDPGKLLGFCAFATGKEGWVKFEEIGVEEVIQHAKRFTKAAKFGPFAGLTEKGEEHENFIIYGLKTAIIRLCSRQLDLTSDAGQSLYEEFEPERAAIAEGVAQISEVEDMPIRQVVDVEEEVVEVNKLTRGSLQGSDIESVATDALVSYLEEHGQVVSRAEREAISQVIFDRGEEVK